MSPLRASQPPPLPPLRARPDTSLAGARAVPVRTLAAPPRSRWGQKYQNKTACTTRSPFPAPSPASRPSVHVPPLRSGTCPAGLLAAPSRSRRGHKYNMQTLKTFNTCATHVPCPTPSPASRPSVHVPPLRSGTCPAGLLAAPSRSRRGLLNTSIHTFQHNYCVSALPHPANDFFFLCSAIHLVPGLASLRPGPRRTSSQRFSGCAHHKSNS